jgi:hypothetical protein
MDAVHNKAVIGLSVGVVAGVGVPGFQFLNLATNSFEPAFASPAKEISEDPLIDPTRNLLLSPTEGGDYEIINVAASTSPAFFENPIVVPAEVPDSAGEDCSTGIALAPREFSEPSVVFIADLTQAIFTPGSPAGTWTAPSQNQSLTESFLAAGASGMAVAQGTHTGVVTGEFGGNNLTAIALPATSGTGIPAITDWVTCNMGPTPVVGGPPPFETGNDPHPVTAYQSPTSGDAIALVANFDSAANSPTQLAVVDLTKMLNPTIVPRTLAGHGCAAGVLPSSVVSFVPVP